jgi:hypothetical protein
MDSFVYGSSSSNVLNGDDSMMCKFVRDDLKSETNTVTDFPLCSNKPQRFSSDMRVTHVMDTNDMKKQFSKEF